MNKCKKCCGLLLFFAALGLGIKFLMDSVSCVEKLEIEE
jgi:hypothetical protein